MKPKREKYNADNILGWSELDFDEIKAAMVNVRFSANIAIDTQLLRDYCSIDDKVKLFSRYENKDGNPNGLTSPEPNEQGLPMCKNWKHKS